MSPLTQQNIDLNAKDNTGGTPIIKIDLNAKDNTGWTSFMNTCPQKGNKFFVKKS